MCDAVGYRVEACSVVLILSSVELPYRLIATIPGTGNFVRENAVWGVERATLAVVSESRIDCAAGSGRAKKGLRCMERGRRLGSGCPSCGG